MIYVISQPWRIAGASYFQAHGNQSLRALLKIKPVKPDPFHLYTAEEQREWWAKDANSVNCKCSTIAVLVDENGKPLSDSIIDKAQKTFNTMKARGYQWAKG